MSKSSNRELIMKTGSLLKRHYLRIKTLDRKKGELERTRSKQIRIDKDIRNCKHDIDDPLRAVTYSITGVSSGNRDGSEIESSLIKSYEQLAKEKTRLKEVEYELIAEIRIVEEKIESIDMILDDLKNEHLEIIKFKFQKNMTDNQIGMKLCCDRSAVSKRKSKILIMIAEEFTADNLYKYG